MALLNKSQIRAAVDLPHDDVDVPEWGGTVRVRATTAKEQDAYDYSLVGNKFVDGKYQTVVDRDNAKARLVVRCIIDEQGNRLFSDKEAEELGSKNSQVIDRLYERIRHLSGATDEAVKEIEGNSTPGQTGSSSSALPGT